MVHFVSELCKTLTFNIHQHVCHFYNIWSSYGSELESYHLSLFKHYVTWSLITLIWPWNWYCGNDNLQVIELFRTLWFSATAQTDRAQCTIWTPRGMVARLHFINTWLNISTVLKDLKIYRISDNLKSTSELWCHTVEICLHHAAASTPPIMYQQVIWFQRRNSLTRVVCKLFPLICFDFLLY